MDVYLRNSIITCLQEAMAGIRIYKCYSHLNIKKDSFSQRVINDSNGILRQSDIVFKYYHQFQFDLMHPVHISTKSWYIKH